MSQTGKFNNNLSWSCGTSYSRVSRRREVRRDEQRLRAAYTRDTGSGGSGSKNRNERKAGTGGSGMGPPYGPPLARERGRRLFPAVPAFERGRRQHPALSRLLGQAEAVYGPRSQGEEAAARSPKLRRGGEAGKGGSGMTLLTAYRCQGKRPPPVPSRLFVVQEPAARYPNCQSALTAHPNRVNRSSPGRPTAPSHT